MKKFYLLVALLVSCGLVACGGDDGGNENDDGGDTGVDTDMDDTDMDDTTMDDTGGDAGTDAVEETVDPVCGDGNVDEGEACDGADLGGATCQSEGFVQGTVSCTAECAIDTSACEADGCSECTGDQTCVSNTCVDNVDPSEYVFSDTLSYVWRIQIPPRQAACCFDYTGDGNVDNALGALIAALGSLGGDINIGEALDDAIAEDDVSILLEYTEVPADLAAGGDIDFSIFLGDNDVDEDGMVDQPWMPNREDGDGIFQVSADSFGPAGSQVQFLGGSVADNIMSAGPSQFSLIIPIPDVLTLDITIEDALIEADIRSEATGIFTNDEEIDIDGVAEVFGGGRLGGVVPIDQVVSILNDLAADCATCAGLDAGDLFAGEETDLAFNLSCTQDVSGASGCTADDGLLCENLGTVCGALGIIGGILDVDTNGNGVNDALSVGLRLSMSGAALGDPAISE